MERGTLFRRFQLTDGRRPEILDHDSVLDDDLNVLGVGQGILFRVPLRTSVRFMFSPLLFQAQNSSIPRSGETRVEGSRGTLFVSPRVVVHNKGQTEQPC